MTDSQIPAAQDIFRDSKKWYLGKGAAMVPSPRIIDLCRSRAGPRILDYGCATGAYCLALRQLGFECVGVDVNEEYVKRARDRGVEASVVKDTLPFEDRSFDTVILIEVLEHVADPGRLITEARRVARKNVLITVPDSARFEELRSIGLTYEHMLERDHVRFFTKTTLEHLLAAYFKDRTVWEGEPRFIHYLLPWYFRKPLTLLAKWGLLKPALYSRLYAECRIAR